ncbi:uncharacterized protein Z520_01193 [Fonsecaea multimorphosa CBS 102226]|uniref:Uncharacterized protein n=1 Tax=Fonsecaea multimorphosa CBS 102226 TaxID=1442371 RepID=A0A0D2K9J0_9EURO|nr:uncharacterized protein Z520_01193 [Fonsecaea multimorphosa CBS 102226]KIY02728.1 hypothetical protein Z520_01193 [Fonsecaea multimorphosa CBS 102226]OAL31589.1 hypothetical protein AYO22_01181 [Fonsecaea multimorphosa]
MFAPTQSHSDGAPEISHGAHYKAPRSWSNLRRWSTQKNPSNNVREQERSSTGLTSATLTDNYNRHHVGATPRQRRVPTLLLKHVIVFLAFSLPIIILALVIKIPEWYAFSADYWVSNSFTHCNFNGLFTPYDKPSISLWDPSGFFYITVSWGKMAFSTAKFIDIVWDIVVGRGGQAFLAVVTFKVSSQYLAFAMREAPVSYNTFESLAFVPPGLMRTGRLAADLLTNRGWRARLIIVWIVSSSLFVLSFSSLVTAMSGYSSDISAVMPDYDNESIAWTNFQVVQFAINDAERIGLPGPMYITVGDTCVQQGFLNDDDDDDDDDDDGSSYSDSGLPFPDRTPVRRDKDDETDSGNSSHGKVDWKYVPANCTTFWHTVQYVSMYGLNGNNHSESNITINGQKHTLAAPTLNITTSYSPVALSTLTTYLNTFSESAPPAPGALSSVSQLTDFTFWLYRNQTYPFSYILDKATCRYSRWHNWGFSFLFLFITSLLLALWAVGTYALWLYTYLNSPQDCVPGEETTGGIYKSSWTLVEAMKRDVGPGAVTPEMEESEIRGLVRRRPGRVIQGVGNINRSGPLMLGESEKDAAVSPSPIAPMQKAPMTRWTAFRTWLPLLARLKQRPTDGTYSPANSVFAHADSTFSSTSHHPILQSPAAPGRTMTMTSRTSGLATPQADSPVTFGFSAAAEADIMEGSGVVSGIDPVSGISVGTGSNGRSRPRLSLSRVIQSASYGNTPRTASVLSPLSGVAGKWIYSPEPMSASENASTMTISPIREDGKNKPGEDDAVRWKNDLGDD